MTSPLDNLKNAPKTWDDGIGAIRGGAKWTVAAFAAVATALFGTGLITRPELSWSDHRGQLIGAGVAALIGVIGIVILIAQVTEVFRPVLVTMKDIEWNGRDPKSYFGISATAAKPYVQLAFARRQRSEREREYSAASIAVRSNPTPAATVRLELADGYLNGARGLEQEFVAGAGQLLDEERYSKVANSRGLKSSAVVWGGAAIVAGIAFQLILSTPKEADKPAAAAAAAPAAAPTIAPGTIAIVSPKAGSDVFWGGVGLDRCVVAADVSKDDPAVSARVVILGGAGTPSHPYVVRTIPITAAAADACPLREFNIVDNVVGIVALDAAAPVTVVYTAIATATSTVMTSGK